MKATHETSAEYRRSVCLERELKKERTVGWRRQKCRWSM